MRTLAVLLIVTLLAPACATARAGGPGTNAAPTTTSPDRDMLRSYLKKLPIGSRIRARLSGGDTVRGTLMDASDAGIVVQRRTRVPEPPFSIPIERISTVDIEAPGSSIGKAVAIGAAAGAGGALGVMLLLAAIFSD
jgi:hypothetical protein